MGEYFDDVHSMPENELAGIPHSLADSSAVRALRDLPGYAGRMALGQALCRQLRYRDAIEVYSEAIALDPKEPEAYRQRAARYIATLQPELAVADLKFCFPTALDKSDLLYRLGIAYYLAGDDAAAMTVQAKAFEKFDDEMGVAAMYWHSMSALRSGSAPLLLEKYHDAMEVGHHTAYQFAMRVATGLLSLPEAVEALKTEDSDLEYAMAAYGTAVYARSVGETKLCHTLLDSIVRRDGFWICYGYLAAWRDAHAPRSFGKTVHRTE